ncbi:hypothetical protein ElyMa_004994700 [Elysia marginata]|uniref:Uncharacterized protein n=1 Tax=Elysia marginata TaxID=1093978 RepID=A0AAV4J8E4_9GAST|nr:hypothetical protein ElyMa_004994700 [Elysia marginata]
MDQGRFEPKPSMLMCLPSRYQLPPPSRSMPTTISPSQVALFGRDSFHSDRNLTRDNEKISPAAAAAQKYRDIAQTDTEPTRSNSRSISDLSPPNSLNNVDRDGQRCSFGITENPYSSRDLSLTLNNTKSRASLSPMKDRMLDHAPLRGNHAPFLSSHHERFLYHPYAYSSSMRHQQLPSPRVESVLEDSSCHSSKTLLQTSSKAEDRLRGVAGVSPKDSANLHQDSNHHHHHSHNHTNSTTVQEDSSGTRTGESGHNHSSDSGLNDSGTSAASLDIDTSDSGLVSGLSDDVTGVTSVSDLSDLHSANKSSTSPGDRQLISRKLDPTAAVDDDRQIKTVQGEDDEDIRVSSIEDDDDEEEGLKSYDPSLMLNDEIESGGPPQRPPSDFSTTGHLRSKQDPDAKIGSHAGDIKGKSMDAHL